MARVEFITHAGQRILRVDLAGLGTDDYLAENEEALRLIFAEPPGSVRLLTIPTRHLNDRMAFALKSWALRKATHVRAEALVGATPFHRVVFLGNKVKYGLVREVFEDEGAAKAWLVSS